jgi:glycosyltransferase involved in cell wall biosynthesis
MKARRALIVAPTMPEFDREGGSRDIADMIRFLCEAGWSVGFVAGTADGGERYTRQLRRLGVDVHVSSDGLPGAVIDGPAPDVVVIAFWHLGETLLPIVRHRWPETRVVVSSIDLHFVRDSRRIFGAVERGHRSFLLDAYDGDRFVRELNVYACADAVLAVSEKEAALVGDLVGDPSLGSWVPVTQGEERSPVPFDERQGLLFVGNFQHGPNVEAVEHLCYEIIPHVDADVLSAHPVLVVGNAPDDRVRRAIAATPAARLVGWVPSLTPYLHRARVSLVPLLHGAGVKGKLVRSLAAGTPVVSTSVGVEGLALEDGRDILVADHPAAFAEAIEQLLTDERTWSSLSAHGRDRITAVHSPDAVCERLLAALHAVFERSPKPIWMAEQLQLGLPTTKYADMARKFRIVAQRQVPVDVPLLVVSKGDDTLVDVPGCRVEHFPQNEDGEHLGWHPADGDDVCARLDVQRARGPHYLALPATAMWWLQRYAGLTAYLEEHYELAVREDDTCMIWRYEGVVTAPKLAARDVVREVSASLRPDVVAQPENPVGGSALVVGVYVADKPTYAEDIVRVVAGTRRHRVTQRWAALGGQPPTNFLADHTSHVALDRRPKFEILNELIGAVDLDAHDYLVVVDDDLALPLGFIDHLLGWQGQLGYALAQPARTSNSFIDHRIVEQQHGSLARRTRFVEIGPVVSIHRSAYHLLLPFDLTSPMGWGYENIWTHRIELAGLTMGIIDAVPVDHSLRPPLANYSWDAADAARTEILARNDHVSLDNCFRVLEVVASASDHR